MEKTNANHKKRTHQYNYRGFNVNENFEVNVLDLKILAGEDNALVSFLHRLSLQEGDTIFKLA